jgi:hypothetical protein
MLLGGFCFCRVCPDKKGIISMTPSESYQPSTSFRESYYNVMYRHALKVTGSDKSARKLADRVYKELERRYANNPISSHIDAYLAAQVYLSYAQRGLGDTDDRIDYADIFSETANMSRIDSLPETMPATQVSRRADAPSTTDENLALKNKQAAPAPIPRPVSTITLPEPPLPGNKQTAIPELMASSAPAPRGPIYYDKKSTVFWTPGVETELPPQGKSAAELAEDLPDFEFPKPPLPRHSVFFSIFNVLLALSCIAAIVFLLIELNILPKPF